jgi:S-DNA-T family DNA segregation ATPase FtsK/SpoIIIE
VLTGLRLLREVDGGRLGRSLLVALAGVVLLGLAAALFAGTAVSGLPGGWGGVIGLAGAHGVDALDRADRQSGVEGPLRLSLMALLAIAGLALGYFALGLRPEERGWARARLRRDPDAIAAKPPRRSRQRERCSTRMAPPRRRARALRSRSPTRPSRSPPPPRCARIRARARPRPARRASRWATIMRFPRSTCSGAAPAGSKTPIDRAGLERNARLLESVLEDFHVRGDIVEVRPGRW